MHGIRKLVATVVSVLGLVSAPAQAGERKPAAPEPNQFEIGRLTFFDSGPPFDYYEVFRVRTLSTGASVERILLTPPVDTCFRTAKVEVASASMQESVEQLLRGENPCAITDKELRRESKRKEKRAVFSGAVVEMRVMCGSETRTLRMDILDRDMFDPNPNTPEHTSWMMGVLSRLDKAVGPGVMEKPMFAGFSGSAGSQPETFRISDEARQELTTGKYDSLFEGAKDKPSELYVEAQKKPAAPSIRLLESSPVSPENFVEPQYPPLARAARIEGSVVLKLDVDPNGVPSSVAVENGHPVLKGTAEETAKSWVFPKNATSQTVRATLEFRTNCPAKTE